MDSHNEETMFNEFKDVMSGSLVAGYKKTHDEKYTDEYVRRLKRIGFSEAQAKNMFLFELMILKHDHIDSLIRNDYVYSSAIDKNMVPLPEEDSWYVDHQWFLISELVRIWDEAEYLWQTERESIREDVLKRIYSITRYSGGNLFVSYIKMVAEKAHTDEKMVQKYAMAEQDLLYMYKWKKDVEHPYKPEEFRNRTIRLNSVGTNKPKTIGILRQCDSRLSLKEAKKIVEERLPYVVQNAMSREEAEGYLEKFRDIDADAEMMFLVNKPGEIDADRSLFLIPVNFGEAQEKLTEPDYDLHFGVRESEMLNDGCKLLCSDLPDMFRPAETVSSELMHYLTIMSPNGLRYMPLFDSYKAMTAIFGSNIRVGVICYETAKSFVINEKLAGIVISPGSGNLMVSADKLK